MPRLKRLVVLTTSRVLAALLAAIPLTATAQVHGPPPQLVITSAVTDLAGPPCTLMARGGNFGRNLGRDRNDVRLADEALDVISSGDTWLLANFDRATPTGPSRGSKLAPHVDRI